MAVGGIAPAVADGAAVRTVALRTCTAVAAIAARAPFTAVVAAPAPAALTAIGSRPRVVTPATGHQRGGRRVCPVRRLGNHDRCRTGSRPIHSADRGRRAGRRLGGSRMRFPGRSRHRGRERNARHGRAGRRPARGRRSGPDDRRVELHPNRCRRGLARWASGPYHAVVRTGRPDCARYLRSCRFRAYRRDHCAADGYRRNHPRYSWLQHTPGTCGQKKRPPPDGGGLFYFVLNVGGDLLSHTLASAVPSALEGLASGFGMGPGVPHSANTTDNTIHLSPHPTENQPAAGGSNTPPPPRTPNNPGYQGGQWLCAQGHTVDANNTLVGKPSAY